MPRARTGRWAETGGSDRAKGRGERAVHGRDDAHVAAKTTRGLRHNGAAALDFTPPRVPVREHFRVHVDDDVVAMRGKGRSVSRFEHALRREILWLRVECAAGVSKAMVVPITA